MYMDMLGQWIMYMIMKDMYIVENVRKKWMSWGRCCVHCIMSRRAC